MKRFILILLILCSGCQARRANPSPRSGSSTPSEAPSTSQAPTVSLGLTGGETQNGDWTYANRARKLLNETKEELLGKIARADANSLLAAAAQKLPEPYSSMAPQEFKSWLEEHIRNARQKENSDLRSFPAGVRNFFYSKSNNECAVEVQPIFYINFGADYNEAEKTFKRAEISKMLLHETSHCWDFNDQQAAQFASRIINLVDVILSAATHSEGGLVILSPKQMPTEQIETQLAQAQSQILEQVAKILPQYIEVEGYGPIISVDIGKAEPGLIACMMGNDNDKLVPCTGKYQYKSASYNVPFVLHTQDGRDLTLTLRSGAVYWLKASGSNNGVIDSNVVIDTASPSRKKFIEIRDSKTDVVVKRLDEELNADGIETGLFLVLSSKLRASPVHQVF